MRKFSYCVSNPPYQRDNQTGSKRSTTDIYPAFQLLALEVADVTTMIYPASWQKNIRSDFGKYLIDHGLKRSVFYSSQDVFDEAIRHNFPISVVITETNYQEEIQVNDVLLPRTAETWIDSISTLNLWKLTQSWPGGYFHGVYEEIPYSNVEYALQAGLKITKTAEDFVNPVEIYIKARPGKQPDGSIWFMDASQIPADVNLDTYRVCVRSSILGRLGVLNDLLYTKNNIMPRIFLPGCVHSNTLATFKTFATQIEAENCKRYVESSVFTELVKLDYSRKSFASYIPDLQDYTNSNPVFMPDDQLPVEHAYKDAALEQRLLLLFAERSQKK